MKVLLDTHIWIWWLTPGSPLTARERAALDRLAERRQVGISTMSLWEAQMLFRKGRLELPVAFAEWLEQATDPQVVAVLPLDVAVVLAVDALPASFHGDPADRIIVATARAHRLPLATRDATIRRSRSTATWKP